MHRKLIVVLVMGVVAGLTAGTARTQCLQRTAEVAYAAPRDSLPLSTAVAVSGDFAYFNTGPVLHVADVSTPESGPVVMGEVTLPGDILAIAVDGSMAYVAMGGAGVSAVDVSNPWVPEQTSVIDTTAVSLDVAVSGRYLYVADDVAGLVVFDLMDPAQPVPVSRLSVATQAVAIGASDACSYAFVASDAAMRVIDVSNPRHPVEVGDFSSYTSADIAVAGGYAFAVGPSNTLLVIDVRNPSTPEVVGRASALFPAPVGTFSVAVSPSHAYVGGVWGITAVHVDPLTAPRVDGSDFAYLIRDIVWSGGNVFAAFSDLWGERAGLAVYRECDGAPADLGSIECGEPVAGFNSFIPAAAFAAGAEGSLFETDVEISNAGEYEAEVTFAWLPRGQNSPVPLLSADYILAAGESRYFANALVEIFGLGPGSTGALRLTSSSESVIGMSRTYNMPDGEAGTFGQDMPAVPASDMITSGERRRITFLCEDAAERANVGCVNGTDRPVRITIGVHDAVGALLGVRTMILGPYGNDQIDRVLQPWQPTRGYVDVWSGTQGALFTCYGSVLDNVTSDPTTVLPQ